MTRRVVAAGPDTSPPVYPWRGALDHLLKPSHHWKGNQTS